MSKPVKQYDLLRKLNLIPEHPTPLLPLDELQAFVQHHFSRRDYYLQIIENHPAPIYLQESAVLKSRAAQLRNAFENLLPAVAFYYAVKSNNHPDVARVMLEAGFGLDVSSGLELETALRIGARDIVFSGPGKTVAELQLAVAHADRVIVLMDSLGELHRLEGIAANADRNVRCGVRLTVNPNGLWRKFGIVPQALSSFWDEVRRCRHIQLLGLQFHTSWNLSPDPQIEFIRVLGKVLAEMPVSFISQIEFIDIGGGYWPAQGEWLQPAGTPEGKLLEALGQQTEPAGAHHRLPATGIEEFAGRLSAAIRGHLFSVAPCRICLEPGRWICNDAVQLLFSVVDKKAPDLVITDAGTNTVGWERFETDYFPILNLTRPAMIEKPCHVLGSLCTPHDVWGYAYWGADIEPGDILMIPNQGAYTYSLRQNFIKPLPEVVTI
jgi:diaminopimelate decarboxylase